MRNGGGDWNNASSWIQLNPPVGQTPISRVPTELDDVRISASLSGSATVNLNFPGSDSLVIGGSSTTGNRCRSMHISGTLLSVDNQAPDYNFKLVVYTGNGGKVIVDSSSNMPKALFYLHGGNPAIKDLEIRNSSFGTFFSQGNWGGISIFPAGKARLVNSIIKGNYFGSVSDKGGLETDNCQFTTVHVELGDSSVASMINTSITTPFTNPALSFHIGKNSSFTSSNLNISASHSLHFYTSGSTFTGNLSLGTDAIGGFNFEQKYPGNPLPNIINGNIFLYSGQPIVGISGDVKISGDLINGGPPELISDTTSVFVNGQHVFPIGGIMNYGNFKFEFFGSGNSRLAWPVGIPLDTFIINKTGCGKVTVDKSLYVSGQLRVQSGQLVLNPNEGIPYKMVSRGNVIVNLGAGIFLRRNAAGVVANMAIGGTLVNNNTSSDSTCAGISNPYNGTILSYNPNVNHINVPVCVNSGRTILSIVSGATYRWERNTGSGYTAISNSPNFSGATSQTLQLINIPIGWNSDSLRCIVNGVTTSHIFILNLVSSLPASVTISSSFNAVCQGQNYPTTFYAHPVNGGQTPGYQWQINGVNEGQNMSQFSPVSLGLNDQIRVIMQSSFTCATPQSSASNILVANTLSVVPAVSIISTATTACAGSPITFTAVPINGGPTPLFSWHVNGVVVANGPTYTIPSVTSPTIVRVYMTSSHPCAYPNFVWSNDITVTVSQGSIAPSVSISASAITICNNGSITFTATPVNGGALPSYQWQVNGVNAGTNSPIFSTTSLTNGSAIRVVMTSSLACANPTTATSNTLSVTVTPANISPSVSISASATTICNNGNVTFTVTPVNGGAQPSYQWLVNGVNAGTNSPIFSTSSLTDGNAIKVMMTSSLACASPSTATSNTITVTVSSSIIPSVNISASATTICNNGNVVFTAVLANGGVQPTYQWQVNGVNAGTNSPTFSTSTLSNGSVVKVIMTSSSPCAVPATATSNSITVTVSTQLIPSISITASAINICNNQLVTFTALPVNGGANPIYQWKKNGINVGINNPIFTTSSILNGDVILATLVSNASCASPAHVTSNGITMSVGNVVPGIAISGSLIVNQGNSTTITSAVTDGGATPTYQWQDSTETHAWQNIANQTTSVLNYTPSSTGDRVRAIMTSSAACANPASATSNVLAFTVARPSIPVERVTIYPNPAVSYLIVDSLSIIDKWSTLTVMSTSGKIYFTRNISGRNKISVPLQGLLPGMYMIRIFRNVGYPLYKKFIKL